MKRHIIQAIASFLSNPFISNFTKGKIYQGNLKSFCVPGLNCYSCPGAAFSCPIGSIQGVLGKPKNYFSYYVLGLIIFFGVLLGRLICGFLCPFGFIQDLLYKIPIKKYKIPERIDTHLRKLKYILLAFVFLFPILITNEFGIGAPGFCKFICPVGIIEGAFPLLIKNPSLRNAIGLLFYWKLFISILVVIASIIIYRPFCKYLCPLGGFYGLFNSLSFYQMNINSNCIDCKLCEKNCPMDVKILENINSRECIRCMKCKSVCPANAIESGFLMGRENDEKYKKA